MTTQPMVSWQLYLAALAKLRRLRELCKTDDEGGGAGYMRLAADDPMDYDPHARPTLGVAVSDVLRILDEEPVNYVVFDESHQVLTGGDVEQLVQQITRAGRNSHVTVTAADFAGDQTSTPLGRVEPPDRGLLRLHRDHLPGPPLIAERIGDPVREFVEVALRRATSPASSTHLLSLVGHRASGSAPITLAEVRAALAILHAAGRVSLGQSNHGPRYMAGANVTGGLPEPALTVLIAEHLDDVGRDGVRPQSLVEYLLSTYRFPEGRQPVLVGVIAALGVLGRLGLATQPEAHGPYFAPRHTPTQEGPPR